MRAFQHDAHGIGLVIAIQLLSCTIYTGIQEIEMKQIEMRVKGHLNQKWSEWFDGLIISHSGPDETMLSGVVADEAALYGIISRLRDLGLKLTSLSSEEIQEDHHERKYKT